MLSESSTTTTWLDRPPLPSQCSRPVGLSTGRARKKNSSTGRAIRSSKQQELLDLDPPPVALDRQLQVVHRRPFHPAEPSAVQQVDDEGDGAEQRPPDQEWAQESHHWDRVPWRTAWPVSSREWRN